MHPDANYFFLIALTHEEVNVTEQRMLFNEIKIERKLI